MSEKIQRQSVLQGFLWGSVVKNSPIKQELHEIWVRSLGQEDGLEEGTATHSSILAWRIPWTEEHGRLQSIGSQSQTWLKWLSMAISTTQVRMKTRARQDGHWYQLTIQRRGLVCSYFSFNFISFLLIRQHVLCCAQLLSHVQLFLTPWTVARKAPLSMRHSPGKNTGVGYHALLQEIFSTQGENPGLPQCRQILYHLNYQGSPRILEWIAYPFSTGSSQPRNQAGVTCIAGRFFSCWATREAHWNG